MILNELWKTEQKSRVVSSRFPSADHNDKLLPKADPDKLLGSGYYSNVSKDKDEHLVKKQTAMRTDDLEGVDGYWAYVRFIVDNEAAQGNPYFPRIYNVLSLKDIDDNEIRRAKIEKLIPVNDASEEELVALCDKLFGEGTYDPESPSAFVRKIEHVISGGRHVKIKDEIFLDFANLFKQFIDEEADKGEFRGIDLHKENVMFRRTGFGLQLVISDPVG